MGAACSRGIRARLAAGALALLCAGHGAVQGAAADDLTREGLGAYATKPPQGLLGAGAVPPLAEFRTGEAAHRAAPTNQWYSSVIFNRWPQPIHAHPMTYRPTAEGFEVGMPERRLVTGDGGLREIRYPHAAALLISPLGFKPQDSRLSNFSDWLAEIRMAAGPDALSATVLHGSPFSYYECSTGDVKITLAAAPNVLADPRAGGDARVASFELAGHAYAVFAPTGATWDWKEPTQLVLHLPAARRYFSVAGLPDSHPATLQDFLAVAYAFPTNTRVEWAYDPHASRVRTTFTVETKAREGDNVTTFMGLYPHQWSSASPRPQSAYHYDSVRGTIRLIAANRFTVERTFTGVLPAWAGLEEAPHRAAVDSLLVGDLAKSGQLYHKNNGTGTYWVGKGIGAAAQLMSVAEAEGKTDVRDRLLHELESRLESWFDGKHATHFMQDSTIGTFVGYPQEYDSISHMNDHHFHYGYWINGAAHVALRDPDWASADKWGGMVGKIIADIATDERGRTDFPFTRNFDHYEGHAWASGDASFVDGNNQESSSEAVNAWAGLILWGEATGNRRVRDLGIYLYTTEIAAVQTYWFDINREVLASDYGKPYASMVFGGKYAYNTWWTLEPRQIAGINLVPLTPASTYLGAKPEYVRSVITDLAGEEKRYAAHGVDDGTPKDIWQDVFAAYLALADADAGFARWSKQGSVENGETRSHTLYWLYSLKEMGLPDLTVTADTTLYSVFKSPAGAKTYLAYNAGTTPLQVTFSDGKTLTVPARSLARTH